MDLHTLNTKNATLNTQKEDRRERFWECYVEGTNGGRHYKHYSLALAQLEAERLARLTGDKVYLFECVGVCQIFETPIKWEIPRR